MVAPKGHCTSQISLQIFAMSQISFFMRLFFQGARGTPDSTHSPKNVTHEKSAKRLYQLVVYIVQLAVYIVME